MQALSCALLATITSIAACGGTVVFEEQGDDGRGGGDAGATSSTSGSQSGSTGSAKPGAPCSDSTDCTTDEVCIIDAGECRKSCSPDTCDSCGLGFVCTGCATSSCDGCKDCVSACMPTSAGRCDDDDPCPAGSACNFNDGTCLPECGAPDIDCGVAAECSECASGSCCGCRDCVALCLPGL